MHLPSWKSLVLVWMCVMGQLLKIRSQLIFYLSFVCNVFSNIITHPQCYKHGRFFRFLCSLPSEPGERGGLLLVMHRACCTCSAVLTRALPSLVQKVAWLYLWVCDALPCLQAVLWPVRALLRTLGLSCLSGSMPPF